MNKRPLSELASIAEIIASVAVVISLLFVGIQVYDNTAVMRASESNDLYDAMREVDMAVLTHPHLMVAVDKGLHGRRSEMSAVETVYYRNYVSQNFGIWEQAYFRADDGLMSSDNYLAWEKNFSEYLRRGLTKEDLDYILPWFDEQFISRVLEIASSFEN